MRLSRFREITASANTSLNPASPDYTATTFPASVNLGKESPNSESCAVPVKSKLMTKFGMPVSKSRA